MKKRRLVTVVVAALTLTTAAAARPQARADLVEGGIGNVPAQLAPGSSFSVTYVVGNRGAARAPGSVTRYSLRNGSASLVAGVVRVRSLEAHGKARGSARLTVPAGVAAASYSLVACVDATRAVREANERNNCRTARGLLAVSTPPAPTPPPPAGAADTDQDGTPDSADCAPRDKPIHPGAPDRPDLAFVDSNCDGIDGDASRSIFVALTGNDASPGTREAPKRTVTAAVVAASTSHLPAVLVAAGTYGEESGVKLLDDVSVYGGYAAATWSRSTANATVISGNPQAALADGATNVTLQLLTLRSIAGLAPGESTYAVRAIDASNLTLERCILEAGDGRAGAAGADGGDGAGGTQGTGGGKGNPDLVQRGEGGGGAAGPVAGTNGGDGGSGGEGDGNGIAGTSGAGPTGGAGGAGGKGGDPGLDGSPGAPGGTGARAGSAGFGGGNTTAFATTVWRGQPGGAGGAGDPGSGGGGGGGGGGEHCFFCLDGGGAGGGGGGAGGLGGLGGAGGQAGGGSFGVYLSDSHVTLAARTTIRAGAGGDGGAGGKGGNGGVGGAGGPGGGFNEGGDNEVGHGGDGGRGGPGAPGGPGGGGAGGPSIGVFKHGDSTADVGSGVTITAGTAGRGGDNALDGIAARIVP